MNPARKKFLRRARAGEGPGALDLLEEAAFLLRRLPASTMALYLAGTVPMLLGALFYFALLTDRVRVTFDPADGALGLVLLYTWMKTAQAVAAGQAMAVLEQRPPTELRWRDWLAIAAAQLRLHAVGLVLVPLAVVLTVPAGWVFAFFQNCTVLGGEKREGLVRLAAAQARMWPLQNHGALAAVLLLGFIGFVNAAFAIYFVPEKLRMLLGFDTIFATSGWSPVNTTLLATAAALTYLLVDPLCKALYVLRCFYGHARHTGVDLLVRARAALAAPLAAAVVGLLLLGSLAPWSAAVAAETAGTENAVVSESYLDGALDDVLAGADYDWRLRDAAKDEAWSSSFLSRFLESIGGFFKALRDAIARFLDRLSADDTAVDLGRGVGGLATFMDLLVPVVLGLVVLAVIFLALRWWAGNRQPEAAPAAPETSAADVVADEQATADQLPEDEWLRLARELLARGEHRLALRALFLGSLAALAQRGLLVLARHKSNRDYERELGRRGGAAGLTTAFTDNRRVLERTWYGREPAGAEDVRRFEENLQVLLGGGA